MGGVCVAANHVQQLENKIYTLHELQLRPPAGSPHVEEELNQLAAELQCQREMIADLQRQLADAQQTVRILAASAASVPDLSRMHPTTVSQLPPAFTNHSQSRSSDVRLPPRLLAGTSELLPGAIDLVCATAERKEPDSATPDQTDSPRPPESPSSSNSIGNSDEIPLLGQRRYWGSRRLSALQSAGDHFERVTLHLDPDPQALPSHVLTRRLTMAMEANDFEGLLDALAALYLADSECAEDPVDVLRTLVRSVVNAALLPLRIRRELVRCAQHFTHVVFLRIQGSGLPKKIFEEISDGLTCVAQACSNDPSLYFDTECAAGAVEFLLRSQPAIEPDEQLQLVQLVRAATCAEQRSATATGLPIDRLWVKGTSHWYWRMLLLSPLKQSALHSKDSLRQLLGLISDAGSWQLLLGGLHALTFVCLASDVESIRWEAFAGHPQLNLRGLRDYVFEETRRSAWRVRAKAIECCLLLLESPLTDVVDEVSEVLARRQMMEPDARVRLLLEQPWRVAEAPLSSVSDITERRIEHAHVEEIRQYLADALEAASLRCQAILLEDIRNFLASLQPRGRVPLESQRAQRTREQLASIRQRCLSRAAGPGCPWRKILAELDDAATSVNQSPPRSARVGSSSEALQ
eukprot:TRINITY_DN7817_c0_g1_i1.p1 TRINITY_DN7817_c0_g1~~TRINITY_DN7817_c0_g1_i1.p1  ORF type:complete len:635 (-),score=84.60 TRINITY_DN7817_c0_g1_i1:121-2025(-)